MVKLKIFTIQRIMKNHILFFSLIITISVVSCTDRKYAPETFKEGSYSTPDWAKGILWYQIFPERFRDGDTSNSPTAERIGALDIWELSPWTGDWYQRADWEQRMGAHYRDFIFYRRYGGDLQGVMDKLDYLQELGVGGIYFNPIFDAVSLHKYDASHFHHIDRYFGPDPEGDAAIMAQEDPSDPSTWQWTSADKLFLELIQEAKKRNIRIIIDGVWNHAGRDFWAFRDIQQNGINSRFKDWYKIIEFSDEFADGFDYEGWWGYRGLPEFTEVGENLHPEVKEHIFHVTRRWMAPDGDVSRGVDGWRLDVVEEVGNDFWREWHALVREINPESYTVAEIWTEQAEHFISDDLFDAVMNYRFAYAVKEFMIDGWIDAEEFGRRLDQVRYSYPEEANFVMQNLMDSHDTPRIASMVLNPGLHYDRDAQPADGYVLRKPNRDEREIQKLIHIFQYTWIGAPMIYYGTESGMWGADDPHDRKPMVWEDLNYDREINHPFGQRREPDDQNFDRELHSFFVKLGQIRNENEVLRTGDYIQLHANGRHQTFAFGRYNGEEWIIALFNRSENEQSVTITLPEWFSQKEQVRDLISGESFRVDWNQITVNISAFSALILK